MINLLLIAVAMISGSPALGQALFPLDESQQGEFLPDPYDDTPSFRSDSKIVGGETASRGAWLWQVAVYRRVMKNGTPVSKGWLFCGGSLIHPRWVLTAAHCLEPESAGRYDAAAPGDLVVVEGCFRRRRTDKIDSCHSGTATRGDAARFEPGTVERASCGRCTPRTRRPKKGG
jgi:hypothetical protein